MAGIDTQEALDLLGVEGPGLTALIARAGKVRLERRGKGVTLCSILNAKCGACPEDCAFCAQSTHARAEIERYPLVDADRMVEAANRAVENKAHWFGIVTSGKAVKSREEVRTIVKAVKRIAFELPVEVCASLGSVTRDVLVELKGAGLKRYHHNLETAESFFPETCTTRRWSESVETVMSAKAAGLAACSGGIFGLGESQAQRVELLEAVRRLDVDSVPLNFLQPVPGTRLEGLRELTPLDCLKLVAVARLMMPDKEIRVCGGREFNLRDLQSWVLPAGADGMMVGGYLTTSGRNVDDDLRMIADAGFGI